MQQIINSDIIGVIPAAGYANRVAPLQCSKEIFPIEFPDGSTKVVSSYLMESLTQAGVKQAYVIIRDEKWDIAKHFKNGKTSGLNLAYVVVDGTESVPHSIENAYPFIKNHTVAFGFPDILFQPASAFIKLFDKQEETRADLVLGLFKAENPEKMDMVDFNDEGSIRNIVIKPVHTSLTYTWIIAVWTPVFTNFMHDYLAKYSKSDPLGDISLNKNVELYLGDVMREALKSGLKAAYVKFDSGSYLDIGTPSDLKKATDTTWLDERGLSNENQT